MEKEPIKDSRHNLRMMYAHLIKDKKDEIKEPNKNITITTLEKQVTEILKTLTDIIVLKEKERQEWADLCIKKQARIEQLENPLKQIIQKEKI